MFQIEMIDLSEQPVLSIRCRTRVEALPSLIGESFHAIMQYLENSGGQSSGAPYVAYYNMDMQNLDVEIGFPVPMVYPGSGEIAYSVIPGGKAVACLYKGPYSEMAPAYDDMNRWIAENSFEATGVAYEYYYTGPEIPEQEHLTRIVLPLK